ncbi:PTS system mannose/fructose/N-acetylgalactosamine-transporter subunit IIB [Oceanobacillus alkalisoli]|uniref:PTS system mannose/fructose/N-acetylgalactosamine-transporter subunit IIB n=1 Tax=Oceanobacillus alkalisoli TaxID=2925113 RepID=UPI001EEFC93F|nr:PTS sugar transporter subunit IIB [Oceanobacillus alkalisoli]MCF3944098.1 PTS sugar transporter subunit IIB [Oceanobacillus alkalisoli]MCG5102505.1 PTS sugar transporter subunit IIB [Oceanobacillus alkalisoli]
MANIKLIRIDTRLIHGQVITKWLKVAGANRIVIIDDDLSEDDFMADIYVAAAPTGISIEILSVNEATQLWKENELGVGNILLLFKDVESCYNCYKQGFPIQYLQIGGLASAPGRVTVLRAVSFDKKDVEQLQEMEEGGSDIYLHIIPEEQKVKLENAIKKFNF